MLDERLPRHEDEEDLVEGATTVKLMYKYLDEVGYDSTLVTTIYDLIEKNRNPQNCIQSFFKQMHEKENNLSKTTDLS